MEDQSFNQELVVQYLLGDVPEGEQVQIEDRAFADRQYLQNILAVESDLIDQYVRGGLTERERRQFEERFLSSSARRQKVEFARALARVAAEEAAGATVVVAPSVNAPSAASQPSAASGAQASWWDSFLERLRGAGPSLQYALAAASLVLLLGASWLIVQTIRLRGELRQLQAEQQAQQGQQGNLEEQVAAERARSSEMAAQLEREQQQRERAEELAGRLRKELERPVQPPKEVKRPIAQPTIASIFLLPGTSRGAAERPRLVVPRAASLARLQLGLEPGDDYRSFRAELASPGGQVIWSRDQLRARRTRAGSAVILNVPASLLGEGEYEMVLKGVNESGASEDVGYYYFRVVKR